VGCTATVGVLSCPDLSEDPPNIQVSEIDRELPVPFSIYESDSRLESEDKESWRNDSSAKLEYLEILT
jgi:hypothetical protein